MRHTEYMSAVVIRSFKDRDTEMLFRDELPRRFANIERIARRKLLVLDAAGTLV